MALIRQTEKSTPLAEAIVYRLGDLVREGRLLREETTRTVEAMLADGRAERDRLVAGGRETGLKEGYEQGYRDGRVAGEQEGRAEAIARYSQELAALLAGWKKSLDEFDAGRDSLLLEARTEVVRLAVDIGRAVVKRQIELHPEIVIEQAAAALGMVVRPSRVRLVVHPKDRPLIESALPGLLARCTNASHIEIEVDANMERGSCVTRLAGGEIDAQIGVQIERIVRAIVPGGPSGEAA